MKVKGILTGLATAFLCVITNQGAVAQDRAADLASGRCAICHGARGEGTQSAFPRLAGQRAEYIEAQLLAFRSHKRADPYAQAYMWAVAAQLSEQDIKSLAVYYENLKPAQEDLAMIAAGKRIYEQGLQTEKVLPCVSCHGEHAEGKGAIPRLAGQHAPYLVKQMLYFQSTRRGGDLHVMHAAVGESMTMQQMEAVAAYAASK